MLKINGPLDPIDPQLVESLQLLPEENQRLVESYGGIGDFLMTSSLFRTYEGGAKIGLKQDRVLIAETLETTHTSKNDSSAASSCVGAIGSEIARKKEKKIQNPSWDPLEDLKSKKLPDNLGPAPSSDNITRPRSTDLTLNGVGTKKQPDVSGPRNNVLSQDNGKKILFHNSPRTKKDNPIPPDTTGPSKVPSVPDMGVWSKKKHSILEHTSETKQYPTKTSKTGKTAATPEHESFDQLKRERIFGGGSIWKNDLLPSNKKVSTSSELDGRKSSSSVSSEDLSLLHDTTGNKPPLTLQLGSSSKDTKKKSSKARDHYANAIAMVTNEDSVDIKAGGKEAEFQEKVMISRGVNTDPLPHVESYRERYEETMKERKSLEDKLEVSEDRMVRMQKQHGHELEVVEKRTRNECHKVCTHICTHMHTHTHTHTHHCKCNVLKVFTIM